MSIDPLNINPLDTYPTARPLFPLVVDEFGTYFGKEDDEVIRMLKSMRCVPSASYVVYDHGVFVFDALVSAFKALEKDFEGRPVGERVNAAIQLATVPPEDAVRVWNVVPYPYRTDVLPSGRHQIIHTIFNGVVPVDFETFDAVSDAYAAILKSESLPYDGDFVYRGVPLRLEWAREDAFKLSAPDWKSIPVQPCPMSLMKSSLYRQPFCPEFTPVNEDAFNRIKALDSQWYVIREQCFTYQQNNVPLIWDSLHRLYQYPCGWDFLSSPEIELSEEDVDAVKRVEQRFPALATLNAKLWYPALLLFWMECYGIESRHDDYAFEMIDDTLAVFIIGKMAVPGSTGWHCIQLGSLIAYAVSCGESTESAFELAREAHLYIQKLLPLANSIEQSIVFIDRDRSADALRGPSVSTFSELLEMTRSKSNIVGNAK